MSADCEDMCSLSKDSRFFAVDVKHLHKNGVDVMSEG